MLTLEGALLNARYLNLICRHSNIVDIGCRSNVTNSFCSGLIGTNPVAHLLLDLADLGTGISPLSVEAVRDTLEMRQPDVMSHWSAPDRVQTVGLKSSGDELTLPALSVTAILCGRNKAGS
jgi:hypothetical protein